MTMTTKSKKKTVKAWAVIQEYQGQHMRSHILYEGGLPLIYIQQKKPLVILGGVERKVVPITITYHV